MTDTPEPAPEPGDTLSPSPQAEATRTASADPSPRSPRLRPVVGPPLDPTAVARTGRRRGRVFLDLALAPPGPNRPAA